MTQQLWPIIIYGRGRRPDDPPHYIFGDSPVGTDIFRPWPKEEDEPKDDPK